MNYKHGLKQYLKASTSVATLLAMSIGSSAYAQTVQDEIIVTATRRAATVQDVPINIAAISGAQLEEQGLSDIAEVLAFVPGINVVNKGGRDSNVIIVRGINADPLGSGDPNNGGGTVATYLGEIPVFIDLKLNDLKQVEVLLGPQGTLYGAGTLGGAIRYIPNKPEFETEYFEVRADAYTTKESKGLSSEVGFTFNLPVAERFALRGSLDFLNDRGFIDYPFVVKNIGVSEPDPDFSDPAARAVNFRPAEDVNGEETFSGRVAARWQPIDAVDATLTYYFQNEKHEGRTVSGLRGTVPAGKYESAQRVLEPSERDNELLALEIVADLGFAELTSATGVGRFVSNGQRDQTDLLISLEYSYETFPTFTAFTREDQEEKFFNQEVRLVSKGEQRYNWIIGGYYNNFETAGTSAEFTPGYAAFAGFNRPDDLEYYSTGTSKLIEKAVFGEVGYEITDKWQVTVGGRYFEYDLQLSSSVDFPLFDPAFVVPEFDSLYDRAFDPTLSQKDNGTLFKFNTSYHINDDVMVYATVSEGFRIGASNGGGPCPAYDPNAAQGNCNLAPGQQFGPDPINDIAQFDERAYGPDRTRNYELGAKTTLMDGAITLNGALFYVEWIDPQLSSATVNASIPITINANGAASQGVELSGKWAVTDQFLLRGSFSYTKSELTADVPSLIRTITPPGFGSAFSDGKDGDRLPGSPETQFSIFANYRHPLSNGNELLFNAGYAWQGNVLTRTGGRGGSLTLPSFGVGNASVVYDAGNWSLTGYIDNLFNEYGETGVRGTPLSNQTILGANVRSHYTNILTPRTIGLRAKFQFE
ncbi:MAG: TonB-dependent receptor [Robiginitomaculum sp.]|nr:MAG: TonB-dependent receptor [Robiginitomaculum sp.]